VLPAVGVPPDGGQKAPGLRGADDDPPVDACRDGGGGPLDAVDWVGGQVIIGTWLPSPSVMLR